MKKILCIAVLFFPALSLFAQSQSFEKMEKITLSVDDAVKMALEKNISVQRGQITLNAAERAKAHSWNSISPTANVSGGLSIPDGIGDSESPSNYTASVTGTLSLSFSPNLFTSIQAARIAYETGRLTFEQACSKVELNVRKTYYGLLYEQENINLQRRNLQTAKEQYEQNLAKYNQGRMSELDVLSAETNYKAKEPDVESAYVTFLNDLETFIQLIGMEKRCFIEFTGSLDDVPTDKEVTLQNVEVNSPTVASLKKQLESASSAILAARFNAYAPSISATWQHGLSTTPNKSSDVTNNGSIRLTATIPLDGVLPWSTRADTVEKAKDTIKDLELQLADAEKTLKVDTESGLRKIRQSQSAIKAKQANVVLAQRTYEMTQQAYNRGTKDLLSLQNANDKLLSAQASLKSEQRNLMNAVLELENTIGVPYGTLLGGK
ncbi:MAG: TolC family protein [Treponema sp.]|nr:TolC family protein [Treponema sp.]